VKRRRFCHRGGGSRRSRSRIEKGKERRRDKYPERPNAVRIPEYAKRRPRKTDTAGILERKQARANKNKRTVQRNRQPKAKEPRWAPAVPLKNNLSSPFSCKPPHPPGKSRATASIPRAVAGKQVPEDTQALLAKYM